jgi:hypothetical protein|tara:strand:+ start:233 stop:352 length:120 start_codon:yes stop_codon:yes gene_type:complete
MRTAIADENSNDQRVLLTTSNETEAIMRGERRVVSDGFE